MLRSDPDAAAAKASPSRRFGLDRSADGWRTQTQAPEAEDSRQCMTSSCLALQPADGSDTTHLRRHLDELRL